MANQTNMLKNVKMENAQNILMPRPLFDKTNTALIKLRRDIKMQKLKGWPNYKLDVIKSAIPLQPEITFGRDDWLANDDFIVLHVKHSHSHSFIRWFCFNFYYFNFLDFTSRN